jgi:hypothetical protein
MTGKSTQRTLSAVRRFTRRGSGSESSAEQQEHCDLCGNPIAETHEHLYDPRVRELACACQACAVLFPNKSDVRYRRLEMSVVPLRGLAIGPAELQGVGIPVSLLCLCPSAEHNRVFAWYPSAAGVVEGDVSTTQLETLVAAFPELGGVEPDLEALVIDARQAPARCFRVSIDVCHKLIGLLRAHPGRSGFKAFERALLSLDEGLHADA